LCGKDGELACYELAAAVPVAVAVPAAAATGSGTVEGGMCIP